MFKARLILASVLALSAAACGQLNQGKQQQTPTAQSGDQTAAPPAARGSTDAKPAESSGGGGDANKPAASTAPANK